MSDAVYDLVIQLRKENQDYLDSLVKRGELIDLQNDEIERIKKKCGEQDNTICDLIHLLKRVESAFELADFPSAEQAASIAALNKVRPYIQEALRDHGEMP